MKTQTAENQNYRISTVHVAETPEWLYNHIQLILMYKNSTYTHPGQRKLHVLLRIVCLKGIATPLLLYS